jgi:hypothetical protein
MQYALFFTILSVIFTFHKPVVHYIDVNGVCACVCVCVCVCVYIYIYIYIYKAIPIIGCGGI